MFAKPRFLAVCLALLVGGPAFAQELLLVPKPEKAPLLMAAASEQESDSWIGDESGVPPDPIAPQATTPIPTAESEVEVVGPGCDSCGKPECASCARCVPCLPANNFYRHRCFVYGDYLYMRAFGPDLVHATQQNAAPQGQGTVPFGKAQNLIQPWQPAFRVGAGVALNPCSSISASYMQFYSNTSDTLGLPGSSAQLGSVVSSVLTPGTVNSGTTFSLVNANSAVNFRMADVMYNALIFGTPNSYMNWSAGARYGHLRQNFEQNALFAQPNNPQFTTSSINFDGVGPRAGLDGRRRIGATRLSAYGQGSISVLFGDFVSGYSQTDTLTTATLAESNWRSARVVPILDFELGLSWTSCNGCWRFGSGYYTAFWFNTVTTPQYISAVQANNFINLSDTITFSGLVVHAEARF